MCNETVHAFEMVGLLDRCVYQTVCLLKTVRTLETVGLSVRDSGHTRDTAFKGDSVRNRDAAFN